MVVVDVTNQQHKIKNQHRNKILLTFHSFCVIMISNQNYLCLIQCGVAMARWIGVLLCMAWVDR